MFKQFQRIYSRSASWLTWKMSVICALESVSGDVFGIKIIRFGLFILGFGSIGGDVGADNHYGVSTDAKRHFYV